MTQDELPALPEPRLWYDPETQRCSSMAPLRPTYISLWSEDDLRAYADARVTAAVLAERERAAEELSTLRAATASVQADQRAENDLLRAQLAASDKAAAWCDKHKPTDGARSNCVICSGVALGAALSQISALCDPSEPECSLYDAYCDESAVVEQVRAAMAPKEQT